MGHPRRQGHHGSASWKATAPAIGERCLVQFSPLIRFSQKWLTAEPAIDPECQRGAAWVPALAAQDAAEETGGLTIIRTKFNSAAEPSNRTGSISVHPGKVISRVGAPACYMTPTAEISQLTTARQPAVLACIINPSSPAPGPQE